MESLPLGLRDIILVLVVLAAIYLAFVLFRLIQVGRRRPAREPHVEPAARPREAESPPRSNTAALHVAEPPPVAVAAMEPEIVPPPPSPPPPAAARQALAAYEEAAPPRENFVAPPAPTFEWDEVKDLFGEAEEPPVATPLPAAPATPRSGGFGEHISDHLARTDMEMEIQRMRDEMLQMRREMEELRAARRVSPQYAEAMELAQRGMGAQDVADRLGISLAEAELVQALSRGQQNFD